MGRLLGYFARGCLLLVPVGLTLYILYFIVSTLDQFLGVPIPGLGLVLTLGLITAAGFLFSNVIGRQIYWLIDQLFARLPFIKLLYTSLRDLVNAFFGEKKNFGQPVSLRLSPESEVRLFGFLTRPELPALSLPTHVAVYVPQAYNIGGQVLIVPREQVEPLDLPATELLTFMMSGGASGLGRASQDPTGSSSTNK